MRLMKKIRKTINKLCVLKKLRIIKNKQIRIESIEPLLASGKVVFRKDWDIVYPMLIEQTVNYPIALNDDAPDALEGS